MSGQASRMRWHVYCSVCKVSAVSGILDEAWDKTDSKCRCGTQRFMVLGEPA